NCLSRQRRTNLLLLDQSRLGRSCFHSHGRVDVLRGPLQRDPSGIYRHPDGASARGRVHSDQSASANAAETADQAGRNRGCHLLYGNECRRERRTLGRCRVAPSNVTDGQELNQTRITMIFPGGRGRPTRPSKPIGGADAFWNTRNTALGRAKDGEGRASMVELIFGNLIDSVDMKGLTKLLAKMPAGCTGAESKTSFF